MIGGWLAVVHRLQGERARSRRHDRLVLSVHGACVPAVLLRPRRDPAARARVGAAASLAGRPRRFWPASGVSSRMRWLGGRASRRSLPILGIAVFHPLTSAGRCRRPDRRPVCARRTTFRLTARAERGRVGRCSPGRPRAAMGRASTYSSSETHDDGCHARRSPTLRAVPLLLQPGRTGALAARLDPLASPGSATTPTPGTWVYRVAAPSHRAVRPIGGDFVQISRAAPTRCRPAGY